MADRLGHLLLDGKVQTLMQLYGSHGHELRFIGGCVRDTLLHRDVVEIDLATTATPEQGMTLLNTQGIKCIPTGITHGTITVVLRGSSYQITTLRQDVATDGRHAKVVFGQSWLDDAMRRDFTINALSLDAKGKIHDYAGGAQDIADSVLRFIGDPDQRIREDYLRILRYFRFLSVLDWIEDDQIIAACIALCAGLQQLSRERIQAELFKLLCGRGVVRVAGLLFKNKIFENKLPQIHDLARFEFVVVAEEKAGICDPLRRLLAMGDYKNTVWLDSLLVLTNMQKKRLQNLRSVQQHPEWAMEKQLYYFGTTAIIDDRLLRGEQCDIAWLHSWQKPIFPLKADDLMPGISEGPALGKILHQAEDYWVAGGFKEDKNDLLAHIRAELVG